jgi:flavin-dependent dehydrogenase
LGTGYIRAGYGWSFPADEELRVGVGSFWPSHHVKEPTVRLAHDLGLPPDGYQGNWIPHQLRDAVEDGVFFVGDSAGHCLPLTAEGIRTALYFGLACGRELRRRDHGTTDPRAGAGTLRRVLSGPRAQIPLAANVQRAVGQMTPSRAVTACTTAMESRRLSAWSFSHYLDIAPPSFVGARAGRTLGTLEPAAAH